MKTISTRSNPAFKQVQRLPLIPDLCPPSAACAARRHLDSVPPRQDLTPGEITPAVYAVRAGQGVGRGDPSHLRSAP